VSITSDVRSYADAALEQGKHVVDQAQARLTDVAGDTPSKVQDRAQGLATKASATYGELRERVATLPGVETVSSTVEPYVAQLHDYRVALAEKVEEFYSGLKNNEQAAKVLAPAELAASVVIDTVNARVVKPVRSLIEPAPAAPATTAPPAAPAAPATPEPPAATTAPPAKPAPAKRAAPRRTTAKD
jgi:heparin binding hemagglutinin HbhA